MSAARDFDRRYLPALALAVAALGLIGLGPWLAPNDPAALDIAARLAGPSWEAPLGRDHLGRCILSRLLVGAQWSLGLSLVISLIGLGIGTLVGVVGAMTGRAGDAVTMRTADVFLAFPELVAAVVIAGVLGPGVWTLILALGAVGWMRYARVARGLCLSISARDYVVQARLAGLGPLGMLRWHYLPAVMPHLLVVWSTAWARSILAISGLGFLGFGMQPPLPEWGTMLLDGKAWIRSAPLLTLWPGLMILIWVLAINLAGDRLRDALADRDAGLVPGRTSRPEAGR